MNAYDDLPNDLEAERYVLACMLQSRKSVADACEVIEPRHMWRPAHKVMFSAMVAMYAAEQHIDPLTLRAWIEADGDTKPFGDKWPVYLSDVYSEPAVPFSVTAYARLVLAAALRRHGIEESVRFRQALMEPSTDPDEILAKYDLQLERVRLLATKGDSGSTGFGDVTEHVVKRRHPLIPGLLDEQDRVVVVGGEGRGKTTLAHQIAFCAAAGIHPFQWGTEIEPRRVFIADFENPALELGRRFKALGETAKNYRGWDEDNLRFYLRMGGINLAGATDSFELMDAIRKFEPHIVIAGPIYKMLTGLRPNEDGLRAHAAVAAFWDKVRERYGSAIWLEAHAPFGNAGRERELRPEGWNGWMKWPEFGFALKQGTKTKGGDTGVLWDRFRGDRVAGRAWPSWLSRNPYYPSSGWPWQANYDKNVLATNMFDTREDDSA